MLAEGSKEDKDYQRVINDCKEGTCKEGRLVESGS